MDPEKPLPSPLQTPGSPPPPLSTPETNRTRLQHEFVAINHSPLHMPEQAVDAGLQSNVLGAARKFTNATLREVTRCTGYGGSGNFHVATEPASESLLVRAAIKNSSPEAIESLRLLLDFVAARGVIAPRYLQTRQGEFSLRDSGQAYSWVCFPFIASHGFFSGSESEQGLVGAEIGRLHATFREYSNQPESRNLLSTLRANGATIPNSIGVTRAEFLEIASRAAVAPQDEATEEVRAHADAAMRALELLESLAPHAAKVSEPVTQLIHRDLHPHNVLNLGTRGAILDFDDVALGSAYNDLGYALHAFVRQGCHHYGSSQAAAMTSAFLTGYCSTNPELPIDGPTIVFHALNECFKRGMKALRERYVDGSMRLHTSFIRKHMRFPGEILFIAEQGGLLNC